MSVMPAASAVSAAELAEVVVAHGLAASKAWRASTTVQCTCGEVFSHETRVQALAALAEHAVTVSAFQQRMRELLRELAEGS